jgi:hypothetical protein
MIFFVDPNHSTSIARAAWREIQRAADPDLNDAQRIELVNEYVEGHRQQFGKFPPAAVLERCANFILKPYTSARRDQEYKIISVYTLERHRSREQQMYEDSYEYK